MKYLTNIQRCRLISFMFIISLLTIYISYYNISSAIADSTVAYLDNTNADDIINAVNIIVSVFNIGVNFIKNLVFSTGLLLLSIILLLTWRIIAINRKSQISQIEYDIYNKLHFAYILLNILIGFICALISPDMTIISIVIEVIALIPPYLIFAILPVKRAYNRTQMTDGSYIVI